ncbi:hypothetical protein Tco_1547702 [Tanacetum coccineum]
MAGEWTKELLGCFIEYYQTNFPVDFKSDLEYLEEKYKMMNDEVHNPNSQNTSPSEINEPYEPSPRMDSYEQPSCLGSTFVYTPHVTYPKEVEKTIGIPIEVEPLDHTKLEDLGLNTCSHDLFLSSKEFPRVDESEPQPSPNLPFLDVNIGGKRGTDLPVNPYSSGSFRMKEVEPLTIHTPPSPHVAYLHRNGRKAYLLEDKQIPSVGVFDEVFLALGWLLEEIHVTWAHLEKKRTRLRLYTKSLKKLCIQSVETVSQVSSDGVRTFEVTASKIW